MRYLLLYFLIFTTSAFAQIANDNTFTAQVDGKEFTTQPRRVKIGSFWWITANAIKPDKSLRIWLGSFNGQDALEPGTYVVVDSKDPYKNEYRKKYADLGKYKGIAAIRYIEETREPRMEYHVGDSGNNDETIVVTTGADGFLEATFSGKLQGTYWKEKASATVFGGVGRLINKMEDKAITKSTGYDSDIDPEGNGYKKQPKTDEVVVANGKVRLKIK
ncbi:hypothetical protein GCM10028807_08310 [Spirosoma daeguense]